MSEELPPPRSETGRPCTRCGKNRVHRSHGSRFPRVALGLFRIKRFRCHECGDVSWRYVPKPPMQIPRRKRIRMVQAAAVAVAVGLMTGLFVIYSQSH